MKKSSATARIEAIREKIRACGLRSTAPRVAVLQKLEESATPQSHGALAEILQDQGFDKATVYRNLMDLTEAGLVTRRDLGDHVWRFELVREETGEHTHPHFMCETCGEVSCLPGVTVMVKTAHKAGADFGRINEILLKGVCARCQ